MIRCIRVMLSIAAGVLALSQSPALARADEGCAGLYAALRSATGETLVEAVRGGDFRCLDQLGSDLDPPLQVAVSLEVKVVTVANSIPEAMADYTGSGIEGVHQLFLYLRAAEYIRFYCLLDRSCHGTEYEPNQYARDPKLPIRNFEHEYAHPLDARFNLHGPYYVDYDNLGHRLYDETVSVQAGSPSC